MAKSFRKYTGRVGIYTSIQRACWLVGMDVAARNTTMGIGRITAIIVLTGNTTMGIGH